MFWESAILLIIACDVGIFETSSSLSTQNTKFPFLVTSGNERNQRATLFVGLSDEDAGIAHGDDRISLMTRTIQHKLLPQLW